MPGNGGTLEKCRRRWDLADAGGSCCTAAGCSAVLFNLRKAERERERLSLACMVICVHKVCVRSIQEGLHVLVWSLTLPLMGAALAFTSAAAASLVHFPVALRMVPPELFLFTASA